MKEKIKQKGFIQILSLAWIIVLVIIASVGTGVFLYVQNRSAFFINDALKEEFFVDKEEPEEFTGAWSFEECRAQGYRIIRSSPLLCLTPEGEIYAEGFNKDQIFKLRENYVILLESGPEFQEDDVIASYGPNSGCDNFDLIFDSLDEDIKNQIEENLNNLNEPKYDGMYYFEALVCELNLGIYEKEYVVWYPSPGKNTSFDIYGKVMTDKERGWKIVLSSSGFFLVENTKINGVYNIQTSHSTGAGSGYGIRYQWNFAINKYERYQRWQYLFIPPIQ